MKSANPVTLLVLGSFLSMALVGCKKFDGTVTPIPAPNRSVPDSGPPISPVDIGVGPGDGIPVDNGAGVSDIDNPNALGPRIIQGNFYADPTFFAEQTVYFHFDSSAINPSEKPKLDEIAAHLTSNPTLYLRAEGHCDERGTDEYNRALGERRALSAREYLIALGIAGDRISTLSYGEDKPAMFGADEISWAKNRRAEFVLLTPKE